MSSARRRLTTLLVLSRALKRDSSARYRQAPGPSRRQAPVEWNEVLDLATELQVAPALWCAVHDWQDGISGAVGEQLHQQHVMNVVRNLRWRAALTEAVMALNRSGIVPLLFKGSLHLVDGTPGVASHRWMGDLDLLVPGDQMSAAGEALEELGYEADPGKPFLHPHELPFVLDRSLGPIELHPVLGSPPIPSVLPVAEAWAESSPVLIGDARARMLSPTHQALHNVLHSAVQDLNHAVGGLPLRQLLTLADLVRAHGGAIDWAAIHRRMEEHDLGSQLRDHLWLAHRFAGMALPDGSWGGWPRLHEARVLVNFALSWPPQVHRNLRFAFGRVYLDSLYGHGDRPLPLARARARHAIWVLSRDRRKALGDVLAPRN